MNNNFNKEVGKMRSLMERMEKPHTNYQAILNEEKYSQMRMLLESRRVNVDSFLQFITKYQIQRGLFVTLGYIQIYPTDTHYPSEDFHQKMSSSLAEFGDDESSARGRNRIQSFIDKSTNTEWDNPTGRGTKAGKPMANKSYPYVIKMTTYTLHWQTGEQFNEKSGLAAGELNDIAGRMSDDLRTRLGIKYDTPEDIAIKKEANKGIPRYKNVGALGNFDVATFAQEDEMGNVNPVKQEYFKDTENMEPQNYERTAIRNFLSDIKPQRALYFGVDEEGNIDPIPVSLGKLLHAHKDSLSEKIKQLSDPEEIALAKEFAEKKKHNDMAIKTFLTHNIAYICGKSAQTGVVGKESVFWVNKNPLFLLEKSKTKARDKFKYLFPNLNNEQLEAILTKYGEMDAESMENPNIR